MLDEKHAAGAERLAAPEKVQNFLVIQIERRAVVNHVPNPSAFCGPFEERLNLDLGNLAMALFDAAFVQVFLNKAAHFCGPVDKGGDHGPARDSFDADNTVARAQIEHPSGPDAAGQYLEHYLAKTTDRGLHPRRGGIFQERAAILAVCYLKIGCDLYPFLFFPGWRSLSFGAKGFPRRKRARTRRRILRAVAPLSAFFASAPGGDIALRARLATIRAVVVPSGTTAVISSAIAVHPRTAAPVISLIAVMVPAIPDLGFARLSVIFFLTRGSSRGRTAVFHFISWIVLRYLGPNKSRLRFLVTQQTNRAGVIGKYGLMSRRFSVFYVTSSNYVKKGLSKRSNKNITKTRQKIYYKVSKYRKSMT